jgi:hypothetical protein
MRVTLAEDSALLRHGHINNIFTKLGLAPGDRDNRRVVAALRYLETR